MGPARDSAPADPLALSALSSPAGNGLRPREQSEASWAAPSRPTSRCPGSLRRAR